MRIGVGRERASGERRVAVVPISVKTYTGWGFSVLIEHGAGVAAGFADDEYESAGATISDPTGTEVTLVVGPPSLDLIGRMAPGSILIGHLEPYIRSDLVAALRDAGVTAVAVEAIPRTTLAQSMDALSSQATAAGYAAVLLAASRSPKLMPMLVTAAGTIAPARVLVLGAGVAGLQAVATAKRLGAIVHAYDIREDTKEQVESLGARFVAAPTERADEAGYAREVGEETQQAQRQVLAPFVADADIVITTAQIPGLPAPRLVDAEMVRAMRRGAVVIDMAAAGGGNVEGSIADEVVDVEGVTILGPTDLAARVPADASRMYSRNLQEIVGRMRSGDALVVDLDDDIIGPATITHRGVIVNERASEIL
jgi:H+-translocating NAD(P) transhydrogenase subunit alpha